MTIIIYAAVYVNNPMKTLEFLRSVTFEKCFLVMGTQVYIEKSHEKEPN